MNEIWTWVKNNKTLFVDFVVILIAAINLAITQNVFPDWLKYLTYVVGVLNVIKIILVGGQVGGQIMARRATARAKAAKAPYKIEPK